MMCPVPYGTPRQPLGVDETQSSALTALPNTESEEDSDPDEQTTDPLSDELGNFVTHWTSKETILLGWPAIVRPCHMLSSLTEDSLRTKLG